MNSPSQHTLSGNSYKSGLYWIFALLVVYMLSGCDSLDDTSEVETSGILQRAQSYLDQGQYRAASIEAKNAIQNEPQSVKAHVLMAKILLEVGQPLTAISQLESLSGANDPEYVATLSEAYIKRSKFFSSKETLDKNSNTLKKSAPFDFHFLMSQTLQGLGDTDQAKQHLDKALSLAPDSSEQKLQALLEYAKFSLRKGEEPAAVAYLDQALNIKKDPEVLLLKGSIAYSQGNLEQAEDQLSNALIELPTTDIIIPLKVKILKGLIQTLTQLGRSSEALIYSKLLAEAAPNAENNQNKFAKALELYKEGKLDEAEALLSELNSQAGNEFSGRMLGLINAIQGDLTEADTFLSEYIDPETASSKAVRVLAETKLRLDQTEEALSILEEKVNQTPNDPEILSVYGLALLSIGETEKALTTIQKTLAIDPQRDNLRIALAKVYAGEGEADKAVNELKTVRKNVPQNKEAIILLSRLYLANGQLDLARQLSKQVLKTHQEKAFANGFAGSIAFAAKDYESSIGYYKKALTLEPQNKALHFGIARSYIGLGKYPQAIAELEQTIAADPNIPRVYKALVTAHELNGSGENALSTISMVAKENIQAWAPLAILSEFYLRKGDNSKALNYLEEALSRNAVEAYLQDQALATYYAIGSTAAKRSDLDQARSMFMKGLQLKPNDLRYLTALTDVEIKSGNTREAQKLIAQISTSYPDSFIAVEMQGDILVSENKLSDAMTKYQEAWANTPRDSLGSKIHQIKASTNDSPVNFLDTWLSKIPRSENANLLMAMHHQKSGNVRSAKKYYEQTLDINPNSLPALNNMAWLKHEQNEQGALELAEKGARLYPENAAILDTYGWILYKSGDKAAAKEILKKAHELAPDDAEIRAHYNQANK